MSQGYQVVEPSGLAALMSNPAQLEFAVAMLQWLADELHAELRGRLAGVEISVICVEYLGAYPALGVTYSEGIQDLGPLIQETADRLLRERSVSAFADFIGKGDVDWKARGAALMAK